MKLNAHNRKVVVSVAVGTTSGAKVVVACMRIAVAGVLIILTYMIGVGVVTTFVIVYA